jgi:Family of unknown function (DUF6152)
LSGLTRKTSLFGILAFCGVLGSSAVPASAHHSAAPFDLANEIVIKGTIKEVQWTNPHAWIQVNVPKDGGAVVEWSFETEGPNVLTRAGIMRNTLKPGDVVTVTGHPLKDGRPGASMITVEKDDGSVLSLNPNLRKPAP